MIYLVQISEILHQVTEHQSKKRCKLHDAHTSKDKTYYLSKEKTSVELKNHTLVFNDNVQMSTSNRGQKEVGLKVSHLLKTAKIQTG